MEIIRWTTTILQVLNAFVLVFGKKKKKTTERFSYLKMEIFYL